MSNELTDRDFWLHYWESKIDSSVKVPKKFLFRNLIEKITQKKPLQSAIELGGFPGFYAVAIKKHFGIASTLLDFYIHQATLHKLIRTNGLQANDIGIIEADLLTYEPTTLYDLVLSCGLIEHFNDTKAIIERHISFMAKEGCLLITLPNFRGINGWIQKTFDRALYDKHVIACMDPCLLQNLAKELGLHNVKAHYVGGFSVWLEPASNTHWAVHCLVNVIWVLGKLFNKVFRFESKWLSPYIVLYAER